MLTNTLKKQKQAIRFPAVCNEMRRSRCYLIAPTHLKRPLIVGIARTDAECAAQNEVVTRCPYRKSNPYVLMMQSAKNGPPLDAPGALNDPANRRILA